MTFLVGEMAHQRKDDKSILDCHRLIRGISRNLPKLVVHDEILRRDRPSTAAFGWISRQHEDGGPCISVWLEEELKATGRPSGDLNDKWIGSVAVNAGQVREEECGVCRSPREVEPAHGDIFDKRNRSGNQLKRVSEKLAEIAVWVRKPPMQGGK